SQATMFSTADTIVAIATPPGRGAIGVVRLSGPEAHAVARTLCFADTPLAPRHATFTRVRTTACVVDQVLITFFPAPHSYTGDDVVEVSAHGSPVILGAIVSAAVMAGARLAEPGEFTLRAYLNNRVDLPQAEAVADLIEAVTPLQARVAFDQLEGTLTGRIGELDRMLFDLIARLEASVDFPEEGYHFVAPTEVVALLDDLLRKVSTLLADGRRGRLIREGLQVAIVGKPNVGKSSLFNALAGAERAIVTPVAGTTRDLVTETVDIGGLRATLIDSAGIRSTDDVVEAIGVDFARKAMHAADVLLVVVDASQRLDEVDAAILHETRERRRVIAANKSDISDAHAGAFLRVSATQGDGLDALRDELGRALDVDVTRDRPSITNLRHLTLMEQAGEALARARRSVVDAGASLSEEFVLVDLQCARRMFEEISGKRSPEDVLANIFSRFCVGK
ncbi:MAG TPA: tRNA uridine-5-carboxymethylaminomethyl(34) synthesis GTPase MnmE, partial [Vicinamibacterales bacterium]|nr:tRNA uridine-5-carboxymethylaminomethyl(34) synthesis GTPase MnmE [Vicinamibacterales bacterium]